MKPPCSTFRSILAAAVLSTLMPMESTAAAFRKAVLVTDCENPMQVEVLDDGRLLYCERMGKVKLWNPETRSSSGVWQRDVEARPNSSTPPTGGAWEAGLLGLTVDPGFQRNHWVYLYYSPRSGREFRVSRLTLGGSPATLADEKVLLTVPVDLEVCCHYAGGLGFDGQGNLLVATGDNTIGFESDAFAPTDFREGRRFFDAARSAGNANDLRGKILRIHPEPDGTASIPTGNLFPPGTANTRPEIYVMGCRNPWRFSVDAKTGTLYFGDVGPDAAVATEQRGPAGFDEFNRTKVAGNFGWPFLLADNRPYRHYDFATKQSGPAGKPVNTVLIAKKMNLVKEFYFSILLDRASGGPVMIACSEGGTSIEDLARDSPEKIIKVPVDIRKGPTDEDLAKVVAGLGVSGDKAAAASQIKALYDLFVSKDCTMVEVNPLAEDADGNLIAADAKIGFDDNAAFRQKEIHEQRDSSQEDPREVAASKWDLNYIGLDGNIGCMVK